MARSAPIPPHVRPTRIQHDAREWPMYFEPAGWRLRSKAKGRLADFRTGTKNLKEATRRAREYLDRRANDPRHSRKGGGTLAALAEIYIETPKRTKANVAENNVSRLRVICRVSGRELGTVTCREVGPEFWQAYQRAALEAKKRKFDLVTRYRENVAINAAVRAARCLFLRALLPAYRAAGLDVRPDAGEAVMLPVPYLPPSAVDDSSILQCWENLSSTTDRLWLVIGLARFAGLRREEISALRGSWIEETGGVISIALRDRPEESWWTKTGRPYHAQVIEPRLAEWLRTAAQKPDELVVPDPPDGSDRRHWFAHEPQRWLRSTAGVKAAKPLHRLRGLYADHVARITADAVAARLAGIKAAQENLGHTTSQTTEAHYLTQP